MAKAREVFVLSERLKDSGEQFLVAGVFSTNEKLNWHMSQLQGFNDGTLEFRIDLLDVDPTLPTLEG